MKPGWLVVIAILLWSEPVASAHRLDEFLQATTIAVAKDRVTLRMCLTPGVDVFRTVVAEIDPNGDGAISEEEQRAYVQRILRELTLSVDGKRLPLRTVSATFPSVERMREGTGDILLTLEADVPLGGANRWLTFENHYQSALAAYLVNCLFPDDPDIRVNGQNRNYEQSFYQLDYTQTGIYLKAASPALASRVRHGWAVAALALLGLLALFWRVAVDRVRRSITRQEN